MKDPDAYEMAEYEDIEIFVPRTQLEGEIDWDKLFHVLVYTGAGFAIVILFTIVLMLLVIAAGLIRFNPFTLEISFEPWSGLLLTLASIGFVVPPLYYIRKRNLPIKSVGIKSSNMPRDIILGVLTGLAMLGVNFVISWMISGFVEFDATGNDMLRAHSIPELVGWVVVMFIAVGLTEELLFRGFLQRRMEMYFFNRKNRYKIYALVITSLLFAALHLDIIGLPTRFILGLFLGYVTQKRSYSILAPTVAHGLNNAIVVILLSL